MTSSEFLPTVNVVPSARSICTRPTSLVTIRSLKMTLLPSWRTRWPPPGGVPTADWLTAAATPMLVAATAMGTAPTENAAVRATTGNCLIASSLRTFS
jgi:hypothetical protein